MSQSDMDFISMMIQARMEYHYASEAEVSNLKGGDRQDTLESQYMNVLSRIPEDDADVIREYCDQIIDFGARSEERFYLIGVQDGFRLYELIQRITAGDIIL